MKVIALTVLGERYELIDETLESAMRSMPNRVYFEAWKLTPTGVLCGVRAIVMARHVVAFERDVEEIAS